MLRHRPPSPRDHLARNILLALLSILVLPLSTLVLAYSHLRILLTGRPALSGRQAAAHPRTVLVTGVGMTKGLVLARAFHLSGHRVVGADFEPGGIPSPGRFSASLAAFYPLPQPLPREARAAPYLRGLLDVVRAEEVDVWVSCSGVASAVDDGQAKEMVEARTRCRAVQLGAEETRALHEKHRFLRTTEDMGLTVPETWTVTRPAAVEEVWKLAPRGRRYLLKPVGVDDAHRGGVLLTKGSEVETEKSLARLDISERNPWILQQFVRGEEFCTHSVVVQGRVRAFVACPSSELLMHYAALPADSALARAMLRFTETYAAKGGKGFNGHLSFDFLVEDTTPMAPEEIVLYPIECNPRAHTAVCLFNGTPGMVDAYFDVLKEASDGPVKPIATPRSCHKYFWSGHDLVEFVIEPAWSLARGRTSLSAFFLGLKTFLVHLIFWRDGTYEVWDPLPWFVLYHLYWPLQFLRCIRRGMRWSRLNVSTLKIFQCK